MPLQHERGRIILLSYLALVAVLAIPYPLPAATAKPADCSIPKPCAIVSNASSGAALQATSAGGFGVFAESGSGSYLAAAIDGESTNPTGNDAGGTFGVGTATGVNPAYGALGYGTVDGLYGETEASASAGGAGVVGYDASGGAPGSGSFNEGVVGQSGQGTGVLGLAGSSPRYENGPPAGVAGVADTQTPYQAIGVYAQGNSIPFDAHNPQTGADVGIDTAQLAIYANNVNTTFYVTLAGSEFLNGTLTTSKGTYVRERGTSGVTRLTYGDRTTVPQIEDVGEGRLASGRGDVTFDSALADTIDAARYVVFVTPEGDCKGLYVTHKTATGFTVRELQSGRSSLPFAYRIVARPRASTETRLAVAPSPNSAATTIRAPGAASRAAFVSPEARLRARLGAQGFARAFAARIANER